MPATHVFLPDDGDGSDRLAGEPLASRLDAEREARMPGGKERDAGGGRHRGQRLGLAECGRRRLFEEDVAARLDRLACHVEADFRRRAERNRPHIRTGLQEGVEILEVLDAVDLAVPADGGGEFEILAAGNRRHVLIPGDLADADKRQ